MSHLEVGGRRHPIPSGELVIGSDPSAGIQLAGTGIAARHAVIQGRPDGQVVIRRAADVAAVLVNGVPLGPNPTPLLHGDKVTVGAHELLFADERRSGSTHYVHAVDPSLLAAGTKPRAQGKATTGTGGRLVSLTDGREYTVTGPSLVIGRDASCDVVLTSKNVSRRHAEIVATPKGYVLVDSSTNGSFVNGRRVEGQHLLARGEVIRCGEHEFRFYADVAPAPAPAAPDAARPAAPAAGAHHRLADTLHGVPGVAPAEAPATPAAPVTPAPPPATPPRTSGAGVLASLVVRRGALKGRRFPIKVPMVNIGRAEYNDIVFPDDSVSTQHAKLQRREGIWVVVDLESTNGTVVDGERVHGETPIAPGALIRFGDVQVMFEPTDDTVDPQKGSSTRLMGAVKLPERPPDASRSSG